MNRLNKLESKVETILRELPDARGDDMYLYYHYATQELDSWSPTAFARLFTDDRFRKEHRISSPESVGRCRRRLQSEKPELRPCKDIQESRINETDTYVDYAIGGYSGGFTDFIDRIDREV